MANAQDERKLTAILAADVVGYSGLIEADESGTLAALRTHRAEVLDPQIAEHRGRIVSTAGDSVLSERSNSSVMLVFTVQNSRRQCGGAPIFSGR